MSRRGRGTPPDLFAEGRWIPDGCFRATLILARHSEDYRGPDQGVSRDGAGG